MAPLRARPLRLYMSVIKRRHSRTVKFACYTYRPCRNLGASHVCARRLQHNTSLRQIPSPTPREETKDRVCANTPSCAISDAQLRASVNTTCGSRPAGDYARRIIATGEGAPPSASKGRAAARHSADDVTAAYTLLQQHAAAQERVPPRTSKTRRCTPTTTSAGQTAVAALPIAAENEQSEGHDASRGEQNHNAVSSNWSVTNIGFNDIKSEARARIERENRDGYVRAAFASQHADRSYLAEAAHFRFRYPHTLGRIAALSHVRSDRVNARSDRTRSVSK